MTFNLSSHIRRTSSILIPKVNDKPQIVDMISLSQMDMDSRNQFYLYFLCLHLAFTTLDIPFLPVCRILEFFVPGLDPIQCFAFTGIGGGLSGDMDVGIDASGSFTSFIYAVWTRYLSLPLRIAVLLVLFLGKSCLNSISKDSVCIMLISFSRLEESTTTRRSILDSTPPSVLLPRLYDLKQYSCVTNIIIRLGGDGIYVDRPHLEVLPQRNRGGGRKSKTITRATKMAENYTRDDVRFGRPCSRFMR